MKADLGKKISWKAGLMTGVKSIVEDPVDVFLSFVNFCEGKVPTKQLVEQCELFEKQRNHIKSEYTKFVEEISEEPWRCLSQRGQFENLGGGGATTLSLDLRRREDRKRVTVEPRVLKRLSQNALRIIRRS